MSTATRKEKEKAARRQDIVDTARNLFWEKGFNKTTMQDIAKQCDLASGTLYLYFPNKHSIYAELMIEGYDILNKRLQESVSRLRDPKKQISRFIDVLFNFAIDSPQYFEIIFFLLQREGTDSSYSELPDEQRAVIDKKAKELKAFVGSSLIPLKVKNKDSKVEAIWSMIAGVIFYFSRDEENFKKVRLETKNIIISSLFEMGEEAHT